MTSLKRQRGNRSVRLVRAFVLMLCGLLLIPALGANPIKAAPSSARSSLGFANATLVRDTGTGRVYLYWAGVRHWIMDPPTLQALGYDLTGRVNLTSSQIATIPDGSTLEVKTVGAGFVFPLAPITSSQVSLLLSTASASPTGSLNLSGGGFKPGETISIGAPNLTFTTTADANGNFSTAVPLPAQVSLGLHHIYVLGQSSGNFGVTVFHAIAPAAAQLTVTPLAVPAGTSISVSGTGFQGSEQVQIFAGTLAAVEAVAGGGGAFGPVSVTIPSGAPAGNVTVIALGLSSFRSALSQVVVGPAIAVSPTTTATATATQTATATATPSPSPTPVGTQPTSTATPIQSVTTTHPRIDLNQWMVHRGSSVKVSGYHFAGGEQVFIRVNGELVKVTAANSNGNFYHVEFFVPADAPFGVVKVTVSGAQSNFLVTQLLKVIPFSSQRISVSPGTAHLGDLVTVTGSGFSGGERVLIRLNHVAVQTTTANSQGNVRAWFHVPANSAFGWLPVTATGNSSGRAAASQLHVVHRSSAVVIVSPARTELGHRIAVAGHGFSGNEIVRLTVRGAFLETTRANGQGAFYLSLLLPGWTARGMDTVLVSGTRSHLEAQVTIFVA